MDRPLISDNVVPVKDFFLNSSFWDYPLQKKETNRNFPVYKFNLGKYLRSYFGHQSFGHRSLTLTTKVTTKRLVYFQ